MRLIIVKKLILISVSLLLALQIYQLEVLGGYSDTSSIAAKSLPEKNEHHKDKKGYRGHITEEQLQKLKLEKAKQLATYFGIKTENKSFEQLKREIEQAKQQNPEKWETFKEQLRQQKLQRLKEHEAMQEGKISP